MSGASTRATVSRDLLQNLAVIHTEPFHAIAELIDNSYDARTKEIKINLEKLHGEPCLTIADNGHGMNEVAFTKLFSYGYCNKALSCYTRRSDRSPIGQYGLGFKSSTMCLGKSVLAISRCDKSTNIGLLSQEYLLKEGKGEVLTPIMNVKGDQWPERKRSAQLDIILKYSPFNSTSDLKAEVENMDPGNGTKLVIFRLKQEEIDDTPFPVLVSDPDSGDIVVNAALFEDKADDGINASKSVNYLKSLREYCSILFMKPYMTIYVGGQKVRTKLVRNSLLLKSTSTYRPVRCKYTSKITIGKTGAYEPGDSYGLMIYYNNRLIRAYDKIGSQKKGEGARVVCVVNANFLTPTHDKQNFDQNRRYNSLMNVINKQYKDYMKLELGDFEQDLDIWRQCYTCKQWKRMRPVGLPVEDNGVWFCGNKGKPVKVPNYCLVREKEDTEDVRSLNQKKMQVPPITPIARAETSQARAECQVTPSRTRNSTKDDTKEEPFETEAEGPLTPPPRSMGFIALNRRMTPLASKRKELHVPGPSSGEKRRKTFVSPELDTINDIQDYKNIPATGYQEQANPLLAATQDLMQQYSVEMLASKERELKQEFETKLATKEQELQNERTMRQTLQDKTAAREQELHQEYVNKLATAKRTLQNDFEDKLSSQKRELELKLTLKEREFENVLLASTQDPMQNDYEERLMAKEIELINKEYEIEAKREHDLRNMSNDRLVEREQTMRKTMEDKLAAQEQKLRKEYEHSFSTKEQNLLENEQEWQAKLSSKERELQENLATQKRTLQQEWQKKLSLKEDELSEKLAMQERNFQNEWQERRSELQENLATQKRNLQRECQMKLSAKEQEWQAKLSSKERELQENLATQKRTLQQEWQKKLSLKEDELSEKLAMQERNFQNEWQERRSELQENLATQKRNLQRECQMKLSAKEQEWQNKLATQERNLQQECEKKLAEVEEKMRQVAETKIATRERELKEKFESIFNRA